MDEMLDFTTDYHQWDQWDRYFAPPSLRDAQSSATAASVPTFDPSVSLNVDEDSPPYGVVDTFGFFDGGIGPSGF